MIPSTVALLAILTGSNEAISVFLSQVIEPPGWAAASRAVVSLVTLPIPAAGAFVTVLGAAVSLLVVAVRALLVAADVGAGVDVDVTAAPGLGVSASTAAVVVD